MTRNTLIILGIILILGAGLRFYGLDWGTDHQTGTFHTFHPDEKTLIDSAAFIGDDMPKIVSSYGKAPMYLLAGFAHSLGFISDAEPFQDIRFTHLVGRNISVLLGTLTILITFLIGRTLGGLWAGITSAIFMVFCAGHIQQSHYYTVDVSLTFWVGLALYIALQLPSKNIWLYIAFGLAIGLATGTRLVGVWLSLPFLLAHLIPREKGGEKRVTFSLKYIRPLFSKDVLGRIFIATTIGIAVALICEPFLLLDPDLFFSESDIRRLIPSMKIAQGEIVKLWTLFDFSTTPYLFYITRLLPDAMGHPLAFAGLLGIGLSLWIRNRTALVLLSWLLPYFLLVGGLHTKPIRYITPMLPMLVILAAWTCVWAGSQIKNIHRYALAIPALFIGIPTLIYGLTTTSIYGHTDSRIVASRWIAKNIPQNATILAEVGGFPTQWMVPTDRYRTRLDQPSFFLNTEGCFPYNEHITFIDDQLRNVDWIVIINENRLRQFEGVPNQYPIGHVYYQKLQTGQLGYIPAAEFRVHPSLFGLSLRSSKSDPTVTAYDHPTVTIYQRNSDVEQHIATWRKEVRQNKNLPDHDLFAGIEAYREGRHIFARLAFQRTVDLRPNFILGYYMIINSYLSEGKQKEAKTLWKKLDEQFDGIPAEIGVGMVKSGLIREGVLYLERNIAMYEQAGQPLGWLTKAAAENWYLLAQEYLKHNQQDAAQHAFQKSIERKPDYLVAYVGLAKMYLAQKQADQALEILNHAKLIDLKNSHIWQLLSEVHTLKGDLDKAEFYAEQAQALAGS